MRLPKRTRGGEVHSSRARKLRQQLVLPAQLLGGLTTRAQIMLILLTRDLLLYGARTNVEMLFFVLHRSNRIGRLHLLVQVVIPIHKVEGLSSTPKIAHPLVLLLVPATTTTEDTSCPNWRPVSE